MGDERAEGEMIEIGDPTDESAAGQPPPRLVIEYRERGVPWMLIPPMIAVAAVAAVMVTTKLMPTPRPPREPASASSGPIVVVPAVPAPTAPAPTTGVGPAVEPSAASASPFELAMGTPPVAPQAPAPAPTAIDPPAEVVAPAEVPEAALFPRVPGLGFDPRGLVDPTPPVDPSVAEAAAPQDPPAGQAGPAVEPGGRVQPEEVDPDVLPVDPREAKARRLKRLAEARLKTEADRGKFHSELRAICRRSAEKAGPQIDALCASYGTEVDPSIQARAERLLSGPAAGVDRPVRINLLRSLGFSEPMILKDIAGILAAHEDGNARGGARSAVDIQYRAALLLLGHPPSRVATPTRSVSTRSVR